MGKNSNIGTFTLAAGTYTIAISDGVTRVSMYLSLAGAATYQGSATVKGFGGASTAISLVPLINTIVSSNNENEYIDTLTIIVSSGTVTIVCNQ